VLGPNASWHDWEGVGWKANGLMSDIPAEWRSKILYPPYEVGDVLWVRETWRPIRNQGGTGMYVGTVSHQIEYRASEGEGLRCKITQAQSGISYVGDPQGYGKLFSNAGWWHDNKRGKWRPAINMPRWAARLFLKVTEVRVERLQEISILDMRAEGMTDDGCLPCLRESFIYFWDSLYAKKGFGWDVNPWVWVITFERLNQ